MTLALINNIAFLIALVAVGQVVITRFHNNPLHRQVLIGLLFGGAALLGMANPVSLSPGVFFDGRTIVVTVVGVMGGGVAALIAAAMVAIYRYQLGGAGATVGVMVVLQAALLGVLARHWWLRRSITPQPMHYLALGVVVQLVQLALFTQIPNRADYAFIEQAWWVILLIYPLATMLLCVIFRNHEQQLIDQQTLSSAQEAVAAAEASSLKRFHAYFDHSIIGLAIASPEKGWIEVNDALCATLGYTRNELTCVSWTELTYSEDLAPDLAQFNRMLSGEINNYTLDKRFIHKDGHLVDAHIAVSCVRKPDSSVDYVVTMVDDISERKKSQLANEALRHQLQATLDALPDLMFEADADGRIVSYHSHRSDLLAAPPEVFLGKRMVDVLPPEVAATCQNAIDEAAKNGFSYGTSYRLALPQGECWFELSVAPLHAAAKLEQHFIMICRDITERKLVEAALRASETEFRALAEAVPQIVWITRPDGWNIYFNQQWVDYTGLTLEESNGHGWNKPFHPDDQQRAWDAWQNATQNDATYSVECRLRRADGAYRWWLIRGVPLRDASGKILKWFGTCTDIEEIIQTAQALRRTQALLATAEKIGRVGGWEIDIQTRQTTWTEAIYDIHELDGTERLTVDEGINYYTSASRPIIEQAVQRAIAQGEPFDLELEIITAKGNRRNVHAVGKADLARGNVSGFFQDITERKQADLLITQSEQRLELAVGGAGLGLWDWQAPTGELTVNDRWRSMLGLDPAGPMPTIDLWHSLVHVDDLPRLDQLMQDVIMNPTGRDFEIEIRARHQDGHYLWIFDKGHVAERAADGSPLRVVGTHLDISARKSAEQALQHTQALLASAEKIGRVGGWEIDIQTRQTTWTEAVYDIHELDSTDRLTVDEGINYYTPKSQPIIEQAVQRALEQGEPFDLELEIITAKGNRRNVHTVGKADLAHGKVSGFFQDITERKRVESALLASNAQLQLLETCVSRLNDIVLITEAEPFDEPGPRIVFVNDAFVRRTGYSREEVMGQTPRILQGEKTQRDELDRISAALKRWEPVRAELINYTKAGEEFWLELDIVPVADATGWYTHWIAVERDITQRKLAEVTMLESEMRYRSMFENNPLPMWVYDCETLAFLSVNDATVAQYGYSRDELQHMSLRDLLPVEDLPKLDAQLAIDLQSRTAAAQVWTSFLKDGTKIQVEVTAHAMDFQGRSARLVLVNDITERIQSEARMHHLAFNDLLTGLPNRRQFLEYADQVLRESKLESDVNTCILLDLDNFKGINDHWGHPCGDELLKQVALRVQECLPSSGFFARLGGDEFSALVTDIGADQAAAAVAAQGICDKILVAMSRGFLIDNREHFTSVSLGIALFGDRQLTVVDLLSRADSAMYSAKADGRNGYRFFDGELQARLSAQAELEGDLRQCIHNDELHLVYQPQINHLGDIVGCEALVRWTHPTRGLVSPVQFVPAAEHSGFILQIGQWVLHTACMALAEWRSSAATAGLAVAVNVSARQFHHPDFVTQVLSELEASGANPTLLKLELTESLLAQDLDNIIQKMIALKTVGVTFSLDDFGTGYSSLAYLKRLPLDQLKIDQGFVRDVLVDNSDAAIVRTVIALGEKLGLNVIAEGVETQAQWEFLKANGCLSYQGYLFSRPLKKNDFEAFCAAKGTPSPA